MIWMRRGCCNVASAVLTFPHVGDQDGHGHAHLLLPPGLLLHLLHPHSFSLLSLTYNLKPIKQKKQTCKNKF